MTRALHQPAILRKGGGGAKSPSRKREGLGEGASRRRANNLSVTGPPPTPPASGRGDYPQAKTA